MAPLPIPLAGAQAVATSAHRPRDLAVVVREDVPAGDIEHAAAILHPRMGKPMREAIGGGQAIIPSNVKIGGVGSVIDIPLGHKNDVWAFDQIDTLSVMVPNAPRPDEIVVIVALADGGRPRPRVAKSGAVPPTSVV